MNLEPTIGLEIHLELKTETKMFCDCLNDSNEMHPNVNICEICSGQPGTLPSLNKNAIIFALKLAQALKTKVNEKSFFARKNYFYPDLPKGYQISQYESPLAEKGEMEYWLGSEKKKAAIRRIHLEEDTARLIHTNDASLADFNRAGLPLLEIVTEPDFHSAKEARAFAEELILLIRYLKISTANLEKGEIRLEVNISLGPAGKLGVKVEIKNLNSLRAVEEAIEAEIKRQKDLIEQGDQVKQETRGWNENAKQTFSQRTKEEAEDYRYFPEPDLPPLLINQELLDQTIMPELPSQRRTRFQKEFRLNFNQANFLTRDERLGSFFEEAVSELAELGSNQTESLYNFLANDLAGLLNANQKNFEDTGLTPHHFAHLIYKFEKKEYSSKIVKDILSQVVISAKPLEELLQKKIKINDEEIVSDLIKKIIAENPKVVQDYKSGKGSALQFIIGLAMEKTQGQVDPEICRQAIESQLK
ncbi:MAG: Asp-tRNA(Asn)/Glu-tRNA(Gln) amidotransferase subunit GatB [Patescibacteria group bacterium]|nr:Asp-tRNA(Asn)/Glu-tRNA(Gln) amidotransferase subunit GatB [Patescibacteria group bacterium]MCL5257798.1 Asp-tRNA(Asn)/Glu-tRNA(Gln) amidotransferase subunit GatB [Patescibacteria group bacterium]